MAGVRRWDSPEIRDVLPFGATFDSQEYILARKHYSELMSSLHDAMRADLNTPALPGSFALRLPDIERGPQPQAGSQGEVLELSPDSCGTPGGHPACLRQARVCDLGVGRSR